MGEVKSQLTIATAGIPTAAGKVFTEAQLRKAGDGRNAPYLWDEETKSLIYYGPNCMGAVYRFPDGQSNG